MPNGHLQIPSGFTRAIDPRYTGWGYRLLSAANEPPRFATASAKVALYCLPISTSMRTARRRQKLASPR